MCAAKKEAKRLEKEAKLAAKAAKGPAAVDKKAKVDKAKKDDRDAETGFVNTTPKGEKKGMCNSIQLLTCTNLWKLQISRCLWQLATIPSP
jgi:hypothetical protein